MNFFHKLLDPPGKPHPRFTAYSIILLLLASAFCVIAGTMAMPDGYVWLKHSISESAAQGMEAAWVARFSFLLYGCAVLWLVVSLRSVWARSVYWMHMVFALSMIGTAAFSHKPWIEGVPFDAFEDFLHSLTATGMGFAFSFGVLFRFLQRKGGERLNKLFDIAALAVATISTPMGIMLPSIPGLIQRIMFAVAYLWYVREALSGIAGEKTSKG